MLWTAPPPARECHRVVRRRRRNSMLFFCGAANDAIGIADNSVAPAFVRYWGVVSTGRRNTGGQLAINTDDGLPNARPIAFGDSPRNQLSHNTIFSAAPIPLRSH